MPRPPKKMRAEIVIVFPSGDSSITLSTRKDKQIDYADLQHFLELAQAQLTIAKDTQAKAAAGQEAAAK